MDLPVKTMTGKTFILKDVQWSDTIASIRDKICKREGIPPKQQRLIIAGKQMEDCRVLADYNPKSSTVIHLCVMPPSPANTTST